MAIYFGKITNRIHSSALLVFLAPFLLFILPLLQGKVLFWGLPVLQFVPWRTYAYDLLSQGILPLWNPLNGMGAPLFANYQSALLYPPGFILHLLYLLGDAPGIAWGYTLLVPAHMGWAGLGMYNLSRQLGFTRRAQVISALAFGLSAYFAARAGFFSMIWAGAWLPWLLWSVEKLTRQGGAEKLALGVGRIGLIFGFQLLAGHAQLTWYSLLLTGIWLAYRTFSIGGAKSFLAVSAKTAAGLLLGLGLALVQLAATYELLLQSQRSSAVDFDLAMTYSFWPWRILTLLFAGMFGNPGLGNYWGYGAYWEDAVYIGIVPLLMALSTIPLLIRRLRGGEPSERSGLTLFLWVVVLFGTLLAAGKNTPLFPWLYQHIPTFNLFQAPARWMIWAVFGLSLLAGIGTEHWSRPSGRRRKWFQLAAAASLAVIAGGLAASFFLPTIQTTFIHSFLYTGGALFIATILGLQTPHMAGQKAKTRWELMMCGFVILDLLLVNAPAIPFNDAALYERPMTDYADYSRAGGRVYLPAWIEQEQKFKRFFRFSDFSKQEDWANLFQLPLPNSNLLRHQAMINNFDPLLPVRFVGLFEKLDTLKAEVLDEWLGYLDAGTALSSSEGSLALQVREINREGRFHWAPCAQKFLTSAEMQLSDELIKSGVVGEKRQCIFIESEPTCGSEKLPNVRREFEVVRAGVNTIVVQVKQGGEGWLVLMDTWYPGWAARIDGEPAEIVRAEYLFKSVCVPEGPHQVVFEYQPGWINYTLPVSIGSFVVIIGMLFVPFKKLRETRNQDRMKKNTTQE